MYVRDKRSPVPKSEAVSRVMSANRAKNTKPELLLRKAIWHSGHRGYRLHFKVRLASPPYSVRDRSVRPDISFVGRRIAIFVHGCYWHRCSKCNYPLPKHNTKFWQAKFARNIERDTQKKADLKRSGWKVFIVWECELKKRFASTISRITKALS